MITVQVKNRKGEVKGPAVLEGNFYEGKLIYCENINIDFDNG
jgi:hypothetical protein